MFSDLGSFFFCQSHFRSCLSVSFLRKESACFILLPSSRYRVWRKDTEERSARVWFQFMVESVCFNSSIILRSRNSSREIFSFRVSSPSERFCLVFSIHASYRSEICESMAFMVVSSLTFSAIRESAVSAQSAEKTAIRSNAAGSCQESERESVTRTI